MNNYLLKLEYDKILEQLSTYCKTYVGKEYVSKLLPLSKKGEVEKCRDM